MRNKETVLKTLKPLIENFQKIFANGDENEKLLYALLILNIDNNRFKDIPGTQHKLVFLEYHLLKTELEFHPSCFQPEEKAAMEALIECADKAFEIVKQSKMMEVNSSNYSEKSVGLLDVHMRNIYRAPKIAKKLEMVQSMIPVDKKNSGVEPGFKGQLLEDLLFYLQAHFPNKKMRLNYIGKFKADRKSLFNVCQNVLPDYLIKLDYAKNDHSHYILPQRADLQRANTIKKLQKKSNLIGEIALRFYQLAKQATTVQVNQSAVREVIGNDLARLFGMKVQDQRLFFSLYPDGALKLMLKAKWLENVQELGPLQGGLLESSNNYVVKKAPFPKKNIPSHDILYVSDNQINIGFHLASALIMDDDDCVGSKGQNKLRNSEEVVGIDFGHVYTVENRIIDKLDQAFWFDFGSKYKNFSVFYDVPRKEHVKGFLVFAKLKGENVDSCLVKAYGEHFYQFFEKLKKGEDEKIIDSYLIKFQELQRKAPASHQADYASLIEEIKNVKKSVIFARNSFVKKFSYYIDLHPNIIDLVEVIEKLHACFQNNASMRSEDGKVLLQHIRLIDPKARLIWKIKKTAANRYMLYLGLDKSKIDIFYTQLIKFWPDCNKVICNELLTLDIEENNVSAVLALFNEEKLKAVYFKADYELQSVLRRQSLKENPYFADFACSLGENINAAKMDSPKKLVTEGLFKEMPYFLDLVPMQEEPVQKQLVK